MLANRLLRECIQRAGINCSPATRTGRAFLNFAFVQVQPEISAGKIRQDCVAARLAATGLPAALKFPNR